MSSSRDSYYDQAVDEEIQERQKKAKEMGIPFELATDLTILVQLLDGNANNYSHSFGIKIGRIKESLRKYTL